MRPISVAIATHGAGDLSRTLLVGRLARADSPDQAREDVSSALLTASRKLDQAIRNRDNNGPLPPDVYKAYSRCMLDCVPQDDHVNNESQCTS
jgi:hypothetical protein